MTDEEFWKLVPIDLPDWVKMALIKAGEDYDAERGPDDPLGPLSPAQAHVYGSMPNGIQGEVRKNYMKRIGCDPALAWTRGYS